MPLRPIAHIHRAKWHDWADTLGVRLEFRTLVPSTPAEWLPRSRLARIAAAALGQRCLDHAVQSLLRAAAAASQLSDAAALERC